MCFLIVETRFPSMRCMWYTSYWSFTFSLPMLSTNSAASSVVYNRYGPFSKVLTASIITSAPCPAAWSAAHPTVSRASWSCSTRSGLLTSPLSPAGMSPASELKIATSRPASLIARSTSSRSSPMGHQNSTAENPASFALANRSGSGTSLNTIDTFAQNFIYEFLLLSRMAIHMARRYREGHDLLLVGFGAGELSRQFALSHDQDPVGDAQDLDEFGGDYQDGETVLG